MLTKHVETSDLLFWTGIPLERISRQFAEQQLLGQVTGTPHLTGHRVSGAVDALRR